MRGCCKEKGTSLIGPRLDFEDEMCSLRLAMFLLVLRNASTVCVCSRRTVNVSLRKSRLVSDGDKIFFNFVFDLLLAKVYSLPACRWLWATLQTWWQSWSLGLPWSLVSPGSACGRCTRGNGHQHQSSCWCFVYIGRFQLTGHSAFMGNHIFLTIRSDWDQFLKIASFLNELVKDKFSQFFARFFVDFVKDEDHLRNPIIKHKPSDAREKMVSVKLGRVDGERKVTAVTEHFELFRLNQVVSF